MTQKPTVFIDGEAGTTGLEIRARLSGRDDITLVSIDPDKRKDTEERRQLLNSVDLAILCLPDAAAKQAVALVDNPRVRLLDASSAYRTAPDWVYGFPEMEKGQRQRIKDARRVSNPGCYPTGMIALVRPLVRSGLLPADYPVTINAVSGYSGGGASLIEKHERNEGSPFAIYGLGLAHKHVAEMQVHGGLTHRPLFSPAVGHYLRGMLVQVPLQLWALPGHPTGEQLHAALEQAYAGEEYVRVMPLNDLEDLRDGAFLDAENANYSNRVELFVYANDTAQQAVLVARLDNLGKGASGAAMQNLNIMLGLPEAAGF